jgi:hypothetical protein
MPSSSRGTSVFMIERRSEMRRCLVVLVVVSCLGTSGAKANLTFDDGGTYNIDYGVGAGVIVGGTTTGTTVNLRSGGSADWVDVRTDSYLNMLAGSAVNDNVLAFFGGFVNMYGGAVGGYLSSVHGSLVNMYGGSVGGLDVTNAFASMYGGSTTSLGAYNHSHLNIYGGSIMGGYLHSDDSAITIYGDGFNYGFGAIPDRSGTLTGTLQSGHQISLTFDLDPVGPFASSTIVLVQTEIVPVPGAVLLGMIGLSIAGVKLRKRA